MNAIQTENPAPLAGSTFLMALAEVEAVLDRNGISNRVERMVLLTSVLSYEIADAAALATMQSPLDVAQGFAAAASLQISREVADALALQGAIN